MLKPQSIRDTVKVYINHSPNPAKKKEIISLSEEWGESEINVFKQLLKQGGYIKIKGNSFRLVLDL
jgi:hypothetical protein